MGTNLQPLCANNFAADLFSSRPGKGFVQGEPDSVDWDVAVRSGVLEESPLCKPVI